jgi:hypothetical protein
VQGHITQSERPSTSSPMNEVVYEEKKNHSKISTEVVYKENKSNHFGRHDQTCGISESAV